MELKAFKICEETIAAEDIDEAKQLYFSQSGEYPEDDDCYEYNDEQLDFEFDDLDENETPTGKKLTARKMLSEIKIPCAFIWHDF